MFNAPPWNQLLLVIHLPAFVQFSTQQALQQSPLAPIAWRPFLNSLCTRVSYLCLAKFAPCAQLHVPHFSQQFLFKSLHVPELHSHALVQFLGRSVLLRYKVARVVYRHSIRAMYPAYSLLKTSVIYLYLEILLQQLQLLHPSFIRRFSRMHLKQSQ